MRRTLILAAFLSLFSFAAHAVCPGNPTTCGNPMQAGTSGSVMYAAAYGVKADGTTDDTAAVKAAVAACTAEHGALLLPPGDILLASSNSITLQNCRIVGAGAPATVSGGNAGTTLLLTATNANVPVFTCQLGWALEGINAYWPNQTTGTTPFPPFVKDDGSNQCGHALVNNVNLINAYDGFIQSINTSWVDIKFANSNMWAAHDLFLLRLTGDSLIFSGMRFTAVMWYDRCGYGSCMAAASTAGKSNTLFHIGAQSNTSGPGVTFVTSPFETWIWRYGFKIDANGIFEGGIVEAAFDGMGTIVDATAGTWGINNILRGSATGCSVHDHPEVVTNCFDMGSGSHLTLDHFTAGGATGDFIKAAGSTIYILGGKVGSIGSGEPGVDHYLVNQTHNNGDTGLYVRDGNFGYGLTPGGAHAHGIYVPTGVDRFFVTGNYFAGFTDVVRGAYSTRTQITNNVSIATTNPAVGLTGGAEMTYFGNDFDNQTQSTLLAGCGTSSTVNGLFSGEIQILGGGPTPTCTLQVPIFQKNMVCQFQIGTGTVLGVLRTGSGKFQFGSGGDMTGNQILYQCSGTN